MVVYLRPSQDEVMFNFLLFPVIRQTREVVLESWTDSRNNLHFCNVFKPEPEHRVID